MFFEFTTLTGQKVLVPVGLCIFTEGENGMSIHTQNGQVLMVKETLEDFKRQLLHAQMQAQMPLQQQPPFGR